MLLLVVSPFLLFQLHLFLCVFYIVLHLVASKYVIHHYGSTLDKLRDAAFFSASAVK